MSLLTVAKLAGLNLSKIGAPAMSSAANSFKQTLLNVPSTEVKFVPPVFQDFGNTVLMLLVELHNYIGLFPSFIDVLFILPLPGHCTGEWNACCKRGQLCSNCYCRSLD